MKLAGIMFQAAGRTLAWILVAVILAAAAALLYLRYDLSPDAPAARPLNTEVPTATQPAIAPATLPLEPPMQFLDVARLHYPRLPTTQPMGALRLEDAAHVVLDDPMFLDASRTLWIMRDDAAPTAEVLNSAPQRQSNVVRENLRYVHWSRNEENEYAPVLICARDDGGIERVDAARRQAINAPADAQWDRAFSWNDRVVVPTTSGVTILNIGKESQIREHAFQIRENGAARLSAPQVILDHRGLLAWMPWDGNQSGSRGAARFVDDQWRALSPADGWAERPIHLVPLLDGSVLQIASDADGKIALSLLLLETPQVNETRLLALVEQLSDPELNKRNVANAELSRYGPGAWPVLERILPDQPPEAQGRLSRILSNRLKPTLGGMTLIDGKMRLLTRFRDGGVLFFADNGVKRPADRGSGELTISPAWICIRPGRPIELLNPWLIHGRHPKTHRVDALGGEWIVTDDVNGPQRFRGNHLVPLLHKNEREFSELWGIDARGRWLFRMPDENAASTTSPAATTSRVRRADARPTLIIDPTIPAFAPRLPVWNLAAFGEIGWTDEGWPAAKKGSTYVLEARGWRLLKDEETLHSAQTEKPLKLVKPPATTQATQPAEPPLLVDEEGNQYFDGTETLRVVRANGEDFVWALPATASGEAPATLIRAAGDRLFLFNQPGRVVRIAPSGDESEPFTVEAIFTRKISSARPLRIWRDPAGRIIIASPGGLLSILFPEGWIPADIRQLMTAQELESIDEE